MKQKAHPLRIAMLGHKRIPSREGGVEVAVEALAARMAARGCAVTCYNRSGHHTAGAEYDALPLTQYRGIRLKTVPAVDRQGLSAVTSSFFASLAAAVGPYDVVHYHAEGPCAMMWLPKLFGKRCIATIHGLDWKRETWRHSIGAGYIRFGERAAAAWADEIIVLSRSHQDYFSAVYHRRTHWIPNGVSRPVPCPARIITDIYSLAGRDYLLFLGRLVPEKGLRYLIQAYRALNTGKKLVIAGGPSGSPAFSEELKALAQGDRRILFTGFVQGPLLRELYSNAYLYILPSDLEGMPLSLLEAMSYGNCCLVSDIPECTEVVEDCGVTFRRGDPEDLRKKLELLCKDEGLVRFYREASAEFVCRKYNWDAVMGQTLALYRAAGPVSPEDIHENSAGQ